jgi:RimJ/RimL family protein N-acetyltransferase
MREVDLLRPRPLSGAPVAPLPTGAAPARTTIVGRDVRLEPLDPTAHAAELFEAAGGSEQALRIWEYLPYGPWSDLATFTAWLREQAASLDPIFYAIRRTDTGRACGMASFLDIRPLDGAIEIGHIWFGVALQGTRAGIEALFLLLTQAMDDLGYRRMQWKCNALNEKSRAMARRLGFRYEGTFYNHLIFKGMNRDTAWYSILDDEWPDVRRVIAAWLHDDNFDAHGHAKHSLTALMAALAPPTRGGR